MYLNKVWRANMSTISVEGLPVVEEAKNNIRPYTKVRMHLELPPNKDPEVAMQALKEKLT
jgi:hypothetical protein